MITPFAFPRPLRINGDGVRGLVASRGVDGGGCALDCPIGLSSGPARSFFAGRSSVVGAELASGGGVKGRECFTGRFGVEGKLEDNAMGGTIRSKAELGRCGEDEGDDSAGRNGRIGAGFALGLVTFALFGSGGVEVSS